MRRATRSVEPASLLYSTVAVFKRLRIRFLFASGICWMVCLIYSGARAPRDIITALKIPVSSSVLIGHFRMSITIFRSNYFHSDRILTNTLLANGIRVIRDRVALKLQSNKKSALTNSNSSSSSSSEASGCAASSSLSSASAMSASPPSSFLSVKPSASSYIIVSVLDSS